MTDREQQILAMIRGDPLVSQDSIAKKLGISRSAVAGHVMNLTSKGIIKGRGYVFSERPFVAVIGGANLDIHGIPAASLRLQDSNPGRVQTSCGGVARNVAENLARFGVDCRLFSAVGNDPHGQLLLQQGRDAGIDMRQVLQLDSAPTSTYLSVLDDAGDMYVGISDMSIIDHLGVEQLRAHEAMLRQAAIIILDTNLCDESLAYLSGTFGETPLFVDTVSTSKSVNIRPYLNAVHTLKPSLIEAEALADMRARTDGQLAKLAGRLHEQGVRRLFITLAERGVFYSIGKTQGMEKFPVHGQDQGNAGGAGDAFLAGLGFAWLKRWPLRRSLQFALAAASVTMSHLDACSPTMSLAEVDRLMRNQHARQPRLERP